MSEEMQNIDLFFLSLSKSIAGDKLGDNIDNASREIQFAAFETFEDKNVGKSLRHGEDIEDVVGTGFALCAFVAVSDVSLESNFSAASNDEIAAIIHSLVDFSCDMSLQSLDSVLVEFCRGHDVNSVVFLGSRLLQSTDSPRLFEPGTNPTWGPITPQPLGGGKRAN